MYASKKKPTQTRELSIKYLDYFLFISDILSFDFSTDGFW